MTVFDCLNKILPEALSLGLSKIGLGNLQEIRIRCGTGTVVKYNTEWKFLARFGISDCRSDAVVVELADMEKIIFRAANFSLYTVNAQLCDAYITIDCGIRIGVAGEPVVDGDKIVTVKNFNCLVIRIPHEVIGCSDFLEIEKVSTLIVGVPGCGKTTVLRDYVRRFSNHIFCPTVVIDERNEIASCKDGVPLLNVGTAEVLSGCTKEYGFLQAVRVLRPGMLVCDELMSESDFASVKRCIDSGVVVTATVHGKSVEKLKDKGIDTDIFERIVLLDFGDKPGILKSIYEI